MRVYVAGSLNDRLPRLLAVETALLELGHEVTSSWLYEPELRNDNAAAREWDLRARANDDWNDIARAEAVVIFTTMPSTTGGRDTELGRALTLGIPTLLVGPRENVFFRRREVYDIYEARTLHHPVLRPLAIALLARKELIDYDREAVAQRSAASGGIFRG